MLRTAFAAVLITLLGTVSAHATNLYPSQVLGTSGLLAYWRLGEAVGPTAAEELGLNPGTYLNSVPSDFGQPGALVQDPNTAVRFNGSTSYVDAGNNASLNGAWGGLTIAAWINPDDVAAGSKLIAGAWSNTVANDHFGLFQNGTALIIAVGDGVAGENGLVGNSTTPLVAGQYNFVVGTWDDATGAYRLYVNGQLDTATANQTGNGINTASTTSIKIGAQVIGAARYFPGIIDEVALFDRALSQSEITQLYELALSPVPEPSSLILLGLGVVGMTIQARRRRRAV